MENMKIFVRNNDVNKALRILKKKMLEEGVTKELRDRKHFVSAGEKKRLAAKAGKKRWLKKRAQLEQKFIREERNQFRKNKQRKNVQRTNQSTNQSRNSQRPSRNSNQRKPRS
jgi:small subunit ribosomal protein S21